MCRFIVIAVVFVGLSSLGCGDALGQGYNILSGRNHPELDWQVAETEHFRILYPRRLAGIEAQAASIAESSYAALSTNLDTTFERKIDLFLSDEDEIVNGIAFPIGNGYTTIWVHAPEFARTMTGSEKWLRSVIAHELAHIFHYQKVLGRPRWLSYALGNPLPRFWTEGLAQYQTEEWTSQRGDRWLRTAVLDDRLSYSDGQSLWNGRLLYAVGNAQLRYLTDRYGDSTLVKILSHRRPVLFGLMEVHDLDAAFEDVTGSSYRSFYDEWRRHVNVYYNTMASRLESADSLDADPLQLPGQYYFQVDYSPDTSYIAVHNLTSLQRPVERLLVVNRETGNVDVIAEGSLYTPISWSPDGRRIAYARLHRGAHGSLVRDLYSVAVDGSDRRRHTDNRRAGSPAFSPDGRQLAFSAADEGTENMYVLDVATDSVEALTDFEDDVHVSSIAWHPEGSELLFDRFRRDGSRDVATLDLTSGSITSLTSGEHDDRDPVYAPNGSHVAYTSLRDDVPNVFVLNRTTGESARVTNLATGAHVMDWLPADSLYPSGSLVIASAASKTRDQAYRIDARRRAHSASSVVPEAYASWTRHRPPETVPTFIEPDTGLIMARHDYRSWRNLRHVASLGFPYVRVGRDFRLTSDWGVAGFTSWVEPLAKHILVAGGAVSFRHPREESYVLASYVNNNWYPSIGLNIYRMPGSAQLYGDDLLVEAYAGGDVTFTWPLDWPDQPYSSQSFSGRFRVVDVEALRRGSFEDAGIPPPEEGQQADVRLAFTWRKQRPYANNIIHPLDGVGVRLQLQGALRMLGTDTQYVRGDASAYGVFRSIGLHRLFVYGRAQVQEGTAFSQQYVGLSRHDAVRLQLPNDVPLLLGETERVRGYRSYLLGDRMVFGSLEYRIPFASGLQTTLLGVASLGSLAGALFVDGGWVWTGQDPGAGIGRAGMGVEIKNALRLGSAFRFAHALGAAQPVVELGDRSSYEVYYRIRTTLPF